MTTYVYLLWRHGEYGPVDTVATLDRGAVVSIAQERFHEAEFDVLAGLLALPDSQLAETDAQQDSDGHRLTDGWGGAHLQVCPLEGS